ncbi:hypothetical protein [Corallococcus sp. AS-1-6]|uniref:hypothetical protein n=1 Tax=Corallococcus sp. AS-1-6 TaxID=2874599 RepID=UPI001CBE55DD|nr:hypothetical protein [Corallococcus sp. AS-1-6]MBZ4373196.1 hypothetical protein [Corallococcus sp. AS-1-6]
MGPGEPRANEGRQTGRVGQYHLGRCIERRTEQGDVYLARHVQTGQPAIVVRPELEESQLVQTTPEEVLEQFPSASLEVTWTSSDSPAFRALQVRLPHAAATAKVHEELVAVSEDLPKLLDRAMGEPELREHLLSPPLTRAQRWRGLVRRHVNRSKDVAHRHWKDAALGLLVVAFLSNLVWPRVDHQAPDSSSQVSSALVAVEQQPSQELLSSGVGEAAAESPEIATFDSFVQAPAPLPFARDLPKKPFKQQKRPPCRKSQKELSGGCWVAVKKEPPCGDEFYEDGDTCYVPVLVSESGGDVLPSISQ